jgi:hypothetical protein
MKQEPDDQAQKAENKSRRTTCATDRKPSQPVIDDEFHPITIKGEPLSEVIIRERRERPW